MERGKGQTRRRSTAAGFTLIEVLLVLIILVIIGSLTVNMFTGTQNLASIRAARAQLSLVDEAVRRYHLDFNKHPPKLTDLWEKPSDSEQAEKWGGPYLTPLKKDPWENDYQYSAQGKKNSSGYDFWSSGPGGKSGRADDIGNWETK